MAQATQEKTKLDDFIKNAREIGMGEEKIIEFIRKYPDRFDFGIERQEPVATKAKQSRPSEEDMFPGGIDVKAHMEKLSQEKAQKFWQDLELSTQNAAMISRIHDTIKTSKDDPANPYLRTFIKETMGYDLDNLGVAAKGYIEETARIRAHEPLVQKSEQEMTPEDLAIRGLGGTGKLTQHGLTGLQLMTTALAPGFMAAYLGAGATLNLKWAPRGFAILDPRTRSEGIHKSPKDMTVGEYIEYEKERRKTPVRYFVTDNALEAARIIKSAYGNKDIPSNELSNLKTISYFEMPGETQLMPINGTPVFRVYSPKSVGEAIGDVGKTIATVGLAGETPGQYFGKITGQENSALPLIADILFGLVGAKAAAPKTIRSGMRTETKSALQAQRGNRGLVRNISEIVADAIPQTVDEIPSFAQRVSMAAGDDPPPLKFQSELSKATLEDLAKRPEPGRLKPDIGPIARWFGSLSYQGKRLDAKTERTFNNVLMANVSRDYYLRDSFKWWQAEVWNKIRPQNKEHFVDMMMGKSMEDIKGMNINDPILQYWTPAELSAVEKMKTGFTNDLLYLQQRRLAAGQEVLTGHPGTYFPGVFRGRLAVLRPDGTKAGFVDTLKEYDKLVELDSGNTGFALKKYKWDYQPQNQEAFNFLPDRFKQSVVEELAKKSGLTQEEIADSLGQLGLKKDAPKPFFLKKKTFAPNAEKDAPAAMEAYFRAMANYRYLSPLREEVEDTVIELTKTHRKNAARLLQSSWDAVSGKQSATSEWFDHFLFEKLGGSVKPRALERWSGRAKQGQGFLYLANPRFSLITNPSQPFETLAIHGTTEEFRRSFQWMNSAEGRYELRRFGHLKPGSKILSLQETRPGKFWDSLQKGVFFTEDINQRWAWSHQYLKARELGLSAEEANRAGVIRGMFGTQYLNMLSDRPPILQGPVISFIQQFKRFSLKNMEQAYDLIRSENYPAAAKFMMSKFLLGGLRAYIPYETYKTLREQDEPLADTIYFGGLGQMLGADLSATYSMLPLGGKSVEEMIGEAFLGVPGETAARTLRNMMMDGQGPKHHLGEAALNALKNSGIPFIKMITKAGDLWDENKAIIGPDGDKLFEEDATAYYKSLLNIPDKRLSVARDMAKHHLAIKKETQTERIKIYQLLWASTQVGGADSARLFEEADRKLKTWNELNAPFFITPGKPLIAGYKKWLLDHGQGDMFDRLLNQFNKNERAFIQEEIDKMGIREIVNPRKR